MNARRSQMVKEMVVASRGWQGGTNRIYILCFSVYAGQLHGPGFWKCTARSVNIWFESVFASPNIAVGKIPRERGESHKGHSRLIARWFDLPNIANIVNGVGHISVRNSRPGPL